MTQRINYSSASPEGYKAFGNVYGYVQKSGLPTELIDLVYLRVSQINGCAFCINMHTAEARKNGETEQRIYLLNAWREADVFTDAEKAMLAFTEEVTLISSHVPDETYANAAKYFDEKYLSDILMMIIIINSWNRMAIATGLRVA